MEVFLFGLVIGICIGVGMGTSCRGRWWWGEREASAHDASPAAAEGSGRHDADVGRKKGPRTERRRWHEVQVQAA